MRIARFSWATLLTSFVLFSPALAQPDVRTWRFDVLLDGRRIGEHEFIAAGRDGALELKTRANFRVEVLFVPFYRYEHRNREVWRGGCLAEIDARTLDNGEELIVRGALDGDRFAVSGPQGVAALPSCVKTFAYWDRSFLQEDRLLNAQTGEYQDIEVTNQGRETLVVSGRERDAYRHTLRSDALNIDLWYSPEGEWLGLESRTTNGRTLRYEIR